MFFNFQDSDGTPLSRYKVLYADLLSFNVARSAANATVMTLYNQADTWLASAALGALSLMSSTDTVLSALGDVYHRAFGRVFEIVPPAVVMTLALLIYVVWAFVDRRANIRSLGQDRNRIAVAVILTVLFSWLLRNPFYLMDRALTWIPSLVIDFLNGQNPVESSIDGGRGTGVSGYLMDSVIRPVTQSLMYGHPLAGDCMHEFSRAMNRGNAPACAPALAEAPQGATLAAGALGAFFLVLLAYGLVLLAMYLYHATMAAWTWVSLLYFMAKSLFEVKALVVPSRKVMVAAGHTLAAAVVNVFAVMGPAVVIAIVNAMTNGDPTFSVVLYICALVVLFFLSRQVTGAVLRKTGVMQGGPGSVFNWVMAPRSMFGDGAVVRRRETAAEIASLTSRSASHLTMFPGAAMLAAGAAAVESKLRPGNAGDQKREAARMPALSDSDRETIDGAIDVITVGAGRERTTETVTWPPALPVSPAGSVLGSADKVAVDNSGVAADPVIESAPSSPGRHREAAVGNGDDDVDVSSPVVFGGLGPHRLPPEPAQIDETAVAVVDPHSNAGIGDVLTADGDRARNIRARSAALFADLGSANRGADSGGGDSVDELLSPMARSYAPPRLRVPAPISSTNAAVQRSGREAVRSSALAAVKRERVRYVLTASGENTVPVSADGDPGMRVYMYNDGTRNVVDPSEGEYVMGQRI